MAEVWDYTSNEMRAKLRDFDHTGDAVRFLRETHVNAIDVNKTHRIAECFSALVLDGAGRMYMQFLWYANGDRFEIDIAGGTGVSHHKVQPPGWPSEDEREKKYVLGFAFLGGSCILIRKTKKGWQEGLVNGLGGQIESGENDRQAMIRGFKDQCGITTFVDQWRHVIDLDCGEYSIAVFSTKVDEYPEITRSHEGEIGLYYSPPPNMESTAMWLYWLCKDESMKGFRISTPA